MPQTETQDWREMPAGRALDEIIAERMEPFASLPVITAHEGRLREWGSDPARWSWTTSDTIASPDGWWMAYIGTDHGASDQDHAPVRWFPATDREPSDDIAAAWDVVDAVCVKMPGLLVKISSDLGGWTAAFYVTSTFGEGEGRTPALAICRAALAATDPTP